MPKGRAIGPSRPGSRSVPPARAAQQIKKPDINRTREKPSGSLSDFQVTELPRWDPARAMKRMNDPVWRKRMDAEAKDAAWDASNAKSGKKRRNHLLRF